MSLQDRDRDLDEHKCHTCGRVTDTTRYAFAWCNLCKRNYCFGGGSCGAKCFLEDHADDRCAGAFNAITNPSWVVNLRAPVNARESDT